MKPKNTMIKYSIPYSIIMLEDLIKKMHNLEKAFQHSKTAELRWISNNLMDEASLHNDKIGAEIAVLAYALHKLESKEHIRRNPKWEKSKKSILADIERAAKALEQKNLEKFYSILDRIGESSKSIDDYLGNFVQNTYDKAKVKQASSAYAHGLSLRKAAELTGCDVKKLQSYVGITKIHDEDKYVLGISDRVEKLKKALGE